MAINSLSSTSKGMSGLASGMDTQSMVDAMLAGTQAKIDKQKATKTQLQYKQTMYRDVMSTLGNFQKNFMSYTGSNNLLNSAFYNTMNAASKSTAFKATATSDAAAGKTVVNSISQLARAYQMKSAGAVSGKVSGTMDLSKLRGQEIQVELDGVRKTIKLPGIDALPVDDTLKPEAMRKAIQESIKKAFGNGITVGGTGSEITFEVPANTNREFVITGDADAMAVLGLNSGASNKVNTAVRLDQLNFGNKLTGSSFKFTINGEKFEFLGSDDLDKVITRINNSDANVRLRYSALDDKFVMESTVSGEGGDIEISQEEGNLLTAMFNVKSGAFTGTSQNTYGTVTGKMPGIDFDYDPSTPLTPDQIAKRDAVLATAAADLDRMTKDANLDMKFLIDGKEVIVSLAKREPDTKHYGIEDLVSAINGNQDFIDNGIKIKLETDADNKPTGAVTIENPNNVRLDSNTLVQSFFGTPANNITGKATGDTTLAKAGFTEKVAVSINGTTIELENTTKMSEAAAAIQAELRRAGATGATVTFDEEGSKGGFRIFGVDIPMTIEKIPGDDKDYFNRIFGEDKVVLGQGNSGTDPDDKGYDEQVGQNAKMVINGIAVERNSNEFTVDGMSYELTSTFNETNDPDVKEEVTVTRDTGKIFEGVSKFMEEYNKVVDKVWGLLKSEANYKEYPPLTDAQKESMSDREVELWEAKSKEGLLRGDKLLDGIMSTMRSTLLAKPEGAKYSLAELGITTAYDMEKGYGGMLKFSDDAGAGETLKKIIAEEPEEIEKLFSDYDTGIITELNKVLSGATMTSPVTSPRKYGELSLVNMAGKDIQDTSSTIYTQVRDINKNLESLNTKYKLEYARYWKQFSAMEQSIASLNSQSSWLTQQFQ